MDTTSSTSQPVATTELQALDASWRAANYLSVGQIHLLDNPLLEQPLTSAHIKPRLVGHWGMTPGLNFLYAHLNRVIKQRALDAIFIAAHSPRSFMQTATCKSWLTQ